MSFDQVVLFVLLGVGPGALIAAIATSVVLSYRGDGVVNVAAGAMTTFGAYVYYGLEQGYLLLPPFPVIPSHIDLGGPVSKPLAIVIALVYCGLVGALLEVAAYRWIRTAPAIAKLVTSIGVLLVLQALIVLRFGGNGQSAPNVLPTNTVSVFGSPIPVNRFILAGIVVIVALALASLYRYTRFGLATRAAQENQDEAVLSGLSPNTLALTNNVIAAVLAGAFGILVAPLTSLDPTTLTLAVVPALAAALLAGFRSFGVAAAAGVVLGIIAALCELFETQSWFPTTKAGSPLPGVPDLIYFVVIVLILALRGKALPARGSLTEARLPHTPIELRTWAAKGTAAFWLAVAAVAVTVLPSEWRQALINSLIGIVAVLSVVVLTGFVAQVSLAQMAIAGSAGFFLSRLAYQHHVGFPLAPILAVLGATILGTAMGAAALRVRGVNLAIVTLAGATAIGSFFFENPDWGAPENGSPVPSPHLFGFDLGSTAKLSFGAQGSPSPMMGYLVLVVLIPIIIFVVRLRRTKLGHSMLAVRSNERAAAGSAVSPAKIKLAAFALSSAIVAVSGVLLSYNLRSVDPASFGFVFVLSLYAFAYIGGITSVLGAVLAGIMLTNGFSTQIITSAGLPVEIQEYVGGVLLILTIVTNPGGIALNAPWRQARALVEKHWGRSDVSAEASTGDSSSGDTSSGDTLSGDGVPARPPGTAQPAAPRTTAGRARP